MFLPRRVGFTSRLQKIDHEDNDSKLSILFSFGCWNCTMPSFVREATNTIPYIMAVFNKNKRDRRKKRKERKRQERGERQAKRSSNSGSRINDKLFPVQLLQSFILGVPNLFLRGTSKEKTKKQRKWGGISPSNQFSARPARHQSRHSEWGPWQSQLTW